MKRIYSISGLLLLFTFLSTAVFAQNVTIKGKVTDAKTGEALIGVTVGVKGTTTGTQTDVNGAFQLSAASNATLQVSYIGYTTQDIAITGQTTLDIKLQPTTNELQGVVVVGYGTQRKIDVTGSVAQIKGSEISKQSSINPISSLQGKVAGVQITNSGAPGASPTVRIRGAGTIYGNANPLYVVDGVWNEDISFLNPNDIESISVLKDASSEAIYGIRAANGVILITTKKGTKNSGAKISYDGFIGTQVVTNDFKMATGPEYATLVNELDERSGVTPRYADPNSFGTTDWAQQVLRSGLINNHNLSINGGGEKSTYSVSFGYLKQQGTVETNSFDRYTMRIKNDFDISKALKIGYTVAGSMNNSHDIDGSIFHQIFAAVPITPVRYADGTYGDPNDFNVTSSAMFNPQVTLDFFSQRSKNYRLNGSAYADLKFANHFTFHTSVGGDFGQGQVVNYAPVYQATLAQQNSNSLLTLTDNKTRNWIIENTLTYDNTFGDHNLKVLVGQGAQSYRYNQTIASATDVPDNGNGYYLSQGKNYNLKDIDAGGGYPFYNTVSSYFARVNYSFKNKYLLNATMRADGSSKFSDPNKWGYFPSVGAGWVISEESFMKDQHVFNSLKLRGSWGKIGNMSVPANLSITTVTQTPQFIYVGPDGYTAPGANVNTITPPVTYWERGVGTDVGIEASLLNDRLFAEVDFYNKKTEKAIFDIPILGSLGTSGSSIIGNQATFQNQGFEFLLSWKDKIGSDFSYSIGGNLGINDNKVLEVSSGRNPIYQAVSTPGSNNFNTRTVVGEPIGQFYGLKVVGIFQTDAEVAAYKNKAGGKIQPEAIAGNFKYQDTNGDGIIDDKDRVVLGNPNPKFTYGFNTYFAYKSFDLTADFQGVAGVQIYNANVGLRFGTENFSQDFYNNRWHGEGTSNTYPSAFIAGGQNNRSNSFYVEDGSYFRIRNLQLGYTLPSAITNSLKIAKVRLYANAQNAFNFFSYKGFSPEVGGGPTRAGVDVNVYPLYATYNFGVNVTF
ncbi:TonB-dependent receptor [Mucilaginibacter sp. AK015]|uniref:SusC/RagA family TonB-linked outer membrane protein n=1 Tax=Mucilaginibacter sp. AK015 TaxID=2723072 RepID=UPI00161B7147|nr:TonB-dependent receptor [Mucilaginibacter sp. AK015]MBB5397074.1 TonB-linked SusC/RagA family outer membrane protein [Mucilaginibacter sp. AK015]